MSSSAKQTPLHDVHVESGARMVDFAGWNMPVQYTGILEEHHAVRNAAGIFDISHMGEFYFSGPNTAASLNAIFTNDVDKLTPGTGQYTLMCNEQGGVIDDLILYRLSEDTYFAVVNASMISADAAHIRALLPGTVSFQDRSSEMGGIALQGPKSEEILREIVGPAFELPERNQLVTWKRNGAEVLIARTGYTGEDGFELFFPHARAADLWKLLIEHGKPTCLPCGLGARDTLRLEACLPLNGNDLSPSVTPLEAGLGIFVSFTKDSHFIGRTALEKMKSDGPPRRLVAFQTEGKTPPPRPHYPILADGRPIGESTSGGMAPTLHKGIGLALIDAPFAKPETSLEIEIRGRRFPITTKKKPLYKRP